jgi:aryl-alcohol dehydrogenase-like predicted oxidoreductase
VIDQDDFGRTGHRSTRVIFGAAALGSMRQERADQVLETLLAYGVNHLDTARSYGDAELRLAPWLAAHPGRFFLATKTGERRASRARAELEESLERRGVDQVDLIQLHNLVEEDEWEVAHGPGGAVEALVRARDEGLVRFIGVTGHGLRIARVHLRSLERFPFDSVLFPYSHVLMEQPDYRADVEELLTTCRDRRVAVQTIKAIARRRWAPDDASPHFAWYEPLEDDGAIARAVRYVLAEPGLFLNTSADSRRLQTILAAADTSRATGRPADEDLAADRRVLGMAPIFDGAELERI